MAPTENGPGASPPSCGKKVRRAQLLHLLAEAADLEHSIACQYLFAAYSLKQRGDDASITPDQWTTIEGWSDTLLCIAIQEMRHLGQVFNLVIAAGGAPVLRPQSFPQLVKHVSLSMEAALTPFNLQTLDRFIRWEAPLSGPAASRGAPTAYLAGVVEQAETRNPAAAPYLAHLQRINALVPPNDKTFSTIGELYARIADLYQGSWHDKGGRKGRFITNKHVPFSGPLMAIEGADDAETAIRLIVEEGEGIGEKAGDQSHYQCLVKMREEVVEVGRKELSFSPARPVIDNPVYIFQGNFFHALPGAAIITNRLARGVGALFSETYEVMLQLVLRSFAGMEEEPLDVTLLLNASMSLMRGALRPLGVVLTALPAGSDQPGLMAGPSFEPYSNALPLPHHEDAWRYFAWRLQDLADGSQSLSAEACAWPGCAGQAHQLAVANVAALLRFWAGQFRRASSPASPGR